MNNKLLYIFCTLIISVNFQFCSEKEEIKKPNVTFNLAENEEYLLSKDLTNPTQAQLYLEQREKYHKELNIFSKTGSKKSTKECFRWSQGKK